MLPVYSPESHSLYQDFFISNFLLYYPDPFSISRQTWKIIVQFWHLDLSQTTSILLGSYSKFGPAPRDPVSMLRSYLLSIKLKITSITDWVSRLKECPLYAIISGFYPDDVPGIGTFYDFFRHIWNSEQKHLSVQLRHKKKKIYMFVASDSSNGLPVFPILERASRHDMLSFLHTFFTMKTWLPEYRVTKLLLDAAHDADAVYRYCQESGIQPFIDLNSGNTGNFIYEDTFTINNDGVPVCKLGLHMKPDGVERSRNRCKWRCPKADRSGCHCETPCSDSSYGRVVHTPVKDNPRLFNIPPRNSLEWDKEYDRRTSVERSNKREKEDYKLEDGKHRSSMMWYCRLYCTMMLQHLDAWEMPSIEAFQSLLSLDA